MPHRSQKEQGLDDYQRERLYRHLNKQREDREKQGISTSPRAYRGSYTANNNSNNNSNNQHGSISDLFPTTGSGPLLLDDSTGHSVDEESLHLVRSQHAEVDNDDREESISLLRSNSHSSFYEEPLSQHSARHSSISSSDKYRLQTQQPQPRRKSNRSSSQHSAQSKTSSNSNNSVHNSQTSSFLAAPPPEDELNDFPGVDLLRMSAMSTRHSQRQEPGDSLQKQEQKRLVFLTAMATCLLLLVAAGGTTFWVLGSRAEKDELDKPDENNLPHPMFEPTPSPTPSPTKFVLEDWAQRMLPSQTWQSIQSSIASPNSSNTIPPVQAYGWIQTDPYFWSNATIADSSSSSSSSSTMTLDEKRRQRFGLAALYYATGGEQWAPQEWLSAQDECEWTYFTCARTSRRRNRSLQTTILRPNQGATLQLRNVPVTGTLPMEISILTALDLLAIYDETSPASGLRGTLPTDLGRLTKLTSLDLHGNRFTGTIPSFLGRLRNLQRLYLHNNAFLQDSMVPNQLCYLTLEELSVDCLSVNCTCGCTCPTGGNSTNTFSNNIFDHTITVETGPLTRFPDGQATTPAPVIDSVSVTQPPTPIPPATSPPNSLPPVTMPPAVPATFSPTPATIAPVTLPPVSLPPQVAPISLSPTSLSSPTIVQVTTPTFNVNNTNGTSTITPMGNDTTLLCNGLANICSFPLPKVLTPVVHNAMATEADGFSLANHLYPVEEAVEAGYRGIALDLCNCDGELVFCHSSCLIGTRSITPLFENLLQFLLDNPREVFVLIIQLNPVQATDLGQFYAVMQGIGNFSDYIYVHDPMKKSAWPTLRNLIEENKRLVMFHYNGPTCEVPTDCPPGLHYYFDYAAETEFGFKSMAEILLTSTSCQITRGASGKHRSFFGINNFLQIPQEDMARTLNAMGFLEPRVEACAEINGNPAVSFLSVDYWSIGNVLDFAKEYNQALQHPPPSDLGKEQRYAINTMEYEAVTENLKLMYSLSDYIKDDSISFRVYDGLRCRYNSSDITDSNPYLILDYSPPADGGPDPNSQGFGTRGPFELTLTFNASAQIEDAPFFTSLSSQAGRLNFCIGLSIGYNSFDGWTWEEEINALETAVQIDIALSGVTRIQDASVAAVVQPNYTFSEPL